ncbi:MAG: T9SS type A sorting domain-containing protein [Saprospiraceae bacterium]|nr:T9SS type A sorting domain-containing protein [Saprospiraceae bacterium]
MMKSLQILFLVFAMSFMVQAQMYEDFESGTSTLPWAGINGATFETVENPDKDALNGSGFVGQVTNNGTSDFNFIITDLPQAADLSKNNLFKMKVWAPFAPSRILFKFEGGGKGVEKFAEITEAGKWVEYTFDLSAGAEFPELTKILIAFNPFTTPQEGVFYFDDISGSEAIEYYETFETGNEMGWLALDGALEAPVDNPDPNVVNNSEKVGKYTKSGAHSYSLLLADRGTEAFDMSILNQFKLHVWSPVASQILLKLEGPGGPAIEKIANIGLTNQWQEYTFDFSAAKDFTHLTKVIIFFDPGVETSADDYYFDNLFAVSKGVCEGVAANPNMIDDFECNRNATYVNGWDKLSVINNPAPNPVNNSAKVGRYDDPEGEPWAALVIDSHNPFNLSENNQLKAKIWSSKAVRVLFKLEGGTSPAKEVFQNITELNQWVDYEIDFSDQAIASHKKIAIFFNAGEESEPGDVYFIDNLEWGVKTVTDLENFENGAFLPWAPLDDLAVLHGSFEVIDNPAPGEPNTSAKVGKYTKGTSEFSTLAAVAPSILDISEKPQYNLDVWAPIGSTSVSMILESGINGNKEVNREIKNAGNWETLSFNFSEFQTITDWAALKLIFNPGTAEPGAMFFFDNLRQGEATVDPCETVVAIPNILDDFECQRNYEYGAGASLLTVVNNPLQVQANGSTKVGLYKDQPNEPWSALCLENPDGFDLSIFNQLELQVLTSVADAPVLLKLEGGSSPAKEVWTTGGAAGEWITLTADFSSEITNDHKRVCAFFNGGVTTTTVDDYYIDNIRFARAPYDACLINFETPEFTSLTWNYFPADDAGGFELVDNPDKSGINTSDKVGKAIEKATGGEVWQGMFTDLDSYIDISQTKKIKMKVWSPQIVPIVMKLERPLKPGAPGSGDNPVTNTKINEWEELTWDFSTTTIVDDGQYARITLIWDINSLPPSDVIYYFDDVKLDGTSCGEPSVSTVDNKLTSMFISPNPVNDLLRVHNTEKIARTEILNVFGQRLAVIQNNFSDNQYINVSAFSNGSYILVGYSAENRAISQARFIKI